MTDLPYSQTSEERQQFLATALAKLVDDSPFDRDLIEQVIKAVEVDQCWPEGQPVVLVRELVNKAVLSRQQRTGQLPGAGKVLQALLLECAYRAEKTDSKFFGACADLVVAEIVQLLWEDLHQVQQGNEPSKGGPSLALLLGVHIGLIPSRKLKGEYARILRVFNGEDMLQTRYQDPFLHDRVLIYDRMDLAHLDKLREETLNQSDEQSRGSGALNSSGPLHLFKPT